MYREFDIQTLPTRRWMYKIAKNSTTSDTVKTDLEVYGAVEFGGYLVYHIPSLLKIMPDEINAKTSVCFDDPVSPSQRPWQTQLDALEVFLPNDSIPVTHHFMARLMELTRWDRSSFLICKTPLFDVGSLRMLPTTDTEIFKEFRSVYIQHVLLAYKDLVMTDIDSETLGVRKDTRSNLMVIEWKRRLAYVKHHYDERYRPRNERLLGVPGDSYRGGREITADTYAINCETNTHLKGHFCDRDSAEFCRVEAELPPTWYKDTASISVIDIKRLAIAAEHYLDYVFKYRKKPTKKMPLKVDEIVFRAWEHDKEYSGVDEYTLKLIRRSKEWAISLPPPLIDMGAEFLDNVKQYTEALHTLPKEERKGIRGQSKYQLKHYASTWYEDPQNNILVFKQKALQGMRGYHSNSPLLRALYNFVVYLNENYDSVNRPSKTSNRWTAREEEAIDELWGLTAAKGDKFWSAADWNLILRTRFPGRTKPAVLMHVARRNKKLREELMKKGEAWMLKQYPKLKLQRTERQFRYEPRPQDLKKAALLVPSTTHTEPVVESVEASLEETSNESESNESESNESESNESESNESESNESESNEASSQ